jgi:hypothetical protein
MDPGSPLTQLIPAALPLLISLLAIGIAAARFRVHPSASAAAIAAFAFQLGGVGLAIGYHSWLARALEGGVSANSMSGTASLVAFAQLAVNVIFLLLVTVAIFIGRKPPTEKT